MTTNGSSFSRVELRKSSLQEGGFKGGIRRRAWLYLFDLEHLDDQLEASTSQLSTANSFGEANGTPPILLESSEIPLDGDGWQIPHSSHLGRLDDDDEEEHLIDEVDEWNVATSKRQKRRKKGMPQRFTLSRSTSAADTIYSMMTDTTNDTALDSIPDTTRTPNQSEEQQDADRLKEERRRKRREKKKRARKGAAIDGLPSSSSGGLEASGFLMPTSQVIEEERDESMRKDWIETEMSSDLKPHRDESQVALDIDRSFIGIRDKRIQSIRREQLRKVVNGVLRKHPPLNYYQGYHDIISVLLLVMIPEVDKIRDVDNAIDVVIELASRISLHLLRDNMTVNMEPTMGHLKLMRNLLRETNPTTAVEVEAASPIPYFALPWLISLFSHDLSMDLILPVFDYLFSRGPDTVIFLCVALILFAKDEEKISDAAEKHHSMSQLPSKMNLETLPIIFEFSDALQLDHSLDKLGKIMGPRSVLSTWSQLSVSTIAKGAYQPPTPWAHADALAEAILAGGTESIVIDAIPTPPASEDGEWFKEHEKKHRRSPKKRREGKGAAPVVALVGAVGAMGLAALIVYGAGRFGIAM